MRAPMRTSSLARALCAVALLGACNDGSAKPRAAPSPSPASASTSAAAARPAPAASLAPSASVAASAPAPAASGSAPPAASPKPKTSKIVGGASTRVELIEPGAEPRVALRYQYAEGRKERARLVSGSGLSMEIAGQKLELPAMPDLEMTATIEILELLGNGSARRRIAIDRVELSKGGLDPSMRGDVESALASLKGLKGRDVIDSRGFIHELRLERAKADPQLRQFLESMQQALGQMGAPFPEEPVGKGARWRIDTKVTQQGIDLRQTANYTLVELDGNKGRAKITLTQSAPAGAVNPPGLPPGVQAELLSLDSKGAGELAFDLTRMVPKGRVTTKSKIRVRTQVPTGGSQDATMHVTARAKFEAAK